jgi:hypothetical protein
MKVFENTPNEFYMDGYLNKNLNSAKDVIRRDWDMIFVVDGSEGSGKSVLTQQMAYFVDPSLTTENIVFTPTELRKRIIEAKPYQAIVYDEAYTGLSSRATMSLINRTLISMLAEIRQRNLFIFVVMPCFFDLDKYVALWRSRALIHVYTGENFQRGFFSFYNVDRKKDLYIKGKKFYSYSQPKPNFIGRFTNHYTVDEKQYKKKKKESLIDREKKKEEREQYLEIQNAMFERLAEMTDDIPHKIKMKILAMPESTYFRKLKQYQEMREFTQ